MLYGFDGQSPELGEETYVSEHALVIGDVKIGDNCYIGHGAILRGDYGTILIGPCTAVEEGVIIHAPPKRTCTIGAMVTIGHGAVIHSAKIGNHVLIGMGAILSINSEIGENTIVAEGTVVKQGQIVAGGVVVGGNPAHVLRTMGAKDTEFCNRSNEIYVDLAKKYLASGMVKL